MRSLCAYAKYQDLALCFNSTGQERLRLTQINASILLYSNICFDSPSKFYKHEIKWLSLNKKATMGIING